MAAYSGTPTLVSGWEEGDRNGKFLRVAKILDLTISSQGGASNTIGDTALGFTSIDRVEFINYTDGSSQNRALNVWTDGTNVLLGDPQASTDNARGEPIDLSGTLRILVAGPI